MPEYIEREAATKAVMAAKWEIGSDAAMAMQIVATAPAADVAPVVHGRWVNNTRFKQKRRKCSECGLNSDFEFNFCPNCGAKMDGEETS